MKKIIAMALAVCFLVFTEANAQSKVKETTKEVGKDVKKGTKKAGKKSAEVASKGKAKVTDKLVEGKTAANGEKVYYDDDRSAYYWIDKKGRKHFVSAGQLKPKADKE